MHGGGGGGGGGGCGGDFDALICSWLLKRADARRKGGEGQALAISVARK